MRFIAALAIALMSTAVQSQTVSPPPCSDGQDQCKPWERDWQVDAGQNPYAKYVQEAEKLGPGPHTLVIADGEAMTEMSYRSGAACQKARDEVRRQVAPPPSTSNVIYGPARIKAFCVPR